MRLFTARRVVVLLGLVLAYYTYVIGRRAVSLLGDGRLAVRGLGAGLLLLALAGVVFLAAEVRFGLRAQRLGRLAGDLGDPADFDAAKAGVEAAPEDWRAWYRLAVAYDAGRDTARGRSALRRAIALERASGGAGGGGGGGDAGGGGAGGVGDSAATPGSGAAD